jgi:RNA polymerase sigma-70 factor (ECF subfamily)
MKGSGRPEGNETERFMALYSCHQKRLYLYTVTLLCGAADAEDVLQEASLVLWQKFGQYQEGTNFFAWACRTVRNKAMEYCRNRRKGGRAVRLLDPDVLDHWADLAAEEIDRFGDSYRGILVDCMERLDPADQELLRQRYTEVIPVQAMAAAMGRSPNAVSQSLGRVRQLLFDCINRKLDAEERERTVS